MKSKLRPMLAASALLAVAGCAGSPVVVSAPNACSRLIPDDWRGGVPWAALPADESDAVRALKDWTAFGVDQSNRLDQSNARTRDALGIIERCEARDRDALGKRRGLFG